MIRSLAYLIIILIGLCLSPYLIGHTGYVYIAIGDYQIETSVIFSALALVLLFGVIHLVESFLVWLFNLFINSRYLPKRWQRNNARKQTLQGLLAFAEQDWAQAETSMVKSADKSEFQVLNLLTAASAAQHQHNDVARDDYLARAETLPMAQQTVQIIRIRYLIEQGKLDTANAELEKLNLSSHSASALLRLAAKLYQRQQNWDALIKLIPLLKKKQLLSITELDSMELNMHLALMTDASKVSLKALEQSWEKLPRNIKGQAQCLALYTQGLAKFNQQSQAIQLLLKQLKKHIEPELILALAKQVLPEDKSAIDYLNGLEPTQEKSAAYQQAMAEMNQRLREFKQAKFHWQKLCELAPSRDSWFALAELQQQLGDNLSAIESYRNAAQLA